MPTARGTLDWKPLADHLDLVAPPVAAAADQAPRALVAPIDEALSDTAQFCQAYDASLETAANCVVVLGRRGDRSTYAAIMVLGSDRADVSKVVKKHLDVRKISFADQPTVEQLTDMLSGGITPLGLPADWPILVDEAVAAEPELIIGAGVRGAKILISGPGLAALPGAQVLPLAIRPTS